MISSYWSFKMEKNLKKNFIKISKTKPDQLPSKC